MRAIVAEQFGGYQDLKIADIPKPQGVGWTPPGADDRRSSPQWRKRFRYDAARQNLPRMLTRVGSHPLGCPSNF
jgi:hypothetical protein